MQGKQLTMLLGVLYGGAFLAGFNENLVNMGLIAIMDEFVIDSVTAQWLVTGFMIASTIVVMCMAFLYRRIRLRVLFFAASALTLAGSVLGLFSTNFAMLLVARIIQAVGSGVFIPLMMNTILAVTPKNKLGSYLSLGGCTITFGPAFAPVVCGALVTNLGWRSIFIAPIAVMVLLGVLGFIYVKDLENSEAHLDAPSVALSGVTLFALSFGLAEIAIDTVLGAISLIIAVAAAMVFVARQLACQYPLIELSPIRRVSFWPAAVFALVSLMSTFSMSVLLPLYLEGACGITAFVAGVVMLIPVLCNAASTLISGRIMDKRGGWPLIPLGFASIAVGFALMAIFASTYSIVAMFFASALVFIGVGMSLAPSQTAGLRTLPPRENPFGVALMTTFTQIAACAGPSLYIGLMSSSENAALNSGTLETAAVAQGFAVAVCFAAALALASAIGATVFCRAALKRSNAASRHAQAQQPTEIALLMEKTPFVVKGTMPVGEVMNELVNRKVSGMPVVDDGGVPIGFISDGDIMRYLSECHPAITSSYSLMEAANSQTFDEKLKELVALPVSHIATERVVSIPQDATLQEACTLLAQHKLKKVPVVQNGAIVGILSRSDVIRYAMNNALAGIGE